MYAGNTTVPLRNKPTIERVLNAEQTRLHLRWYSNANAAERVCEAH